MSFRGYVFAILILCAGVRYLWRETEPNQKSGSHVSGPVAHDSVKRVSQRAPAAQNTQEASSSSDEKLSENDCWARINSQIRESADFRFRLENRLGTFIDSWYYRKDETLPRTPTHSAANLFMLGLAKAGLLGSSRDFVKSEALALEYLEEAAILDPSNSAPMIYAAVVAAKLGLTSKSDLYYRLALDRGDRFDSYLKTITNEVYANVENADDYLAAAELLATTPVPEYSVLKDYLRAPGGKKLAIQMMQDGLNKPEPDDMVDFVPIEYAVGRSMIGEDSKYPTLKQLWEKHPPGEESIEMTKALEETCEISSLEPAVRRLKERLSARYKPE